MRKFSLIFYILTTCIYLLDIGQSDELNSCLFVNETKNNNNNNEKFMHVISSLTGQNYVTEKDGYEYAISICHDLSKDNEYATVTQTKNKETIVIGRRNDTRRMYGDSWLILRYGSGDYKADKKDLVRRSASIYFICNPDGHIKEHHIQLVDDDGKNYKFIFPTQTVCNYNEEMSGVEIFLIIVVTSITLYCLIGVAYNRYVYNARGGQQIPHLRFWSKIGNTLADGCNYVCRCETEADDSWNNIMSNFESGDRDDALLRP